MIAAPYAGSSLEGPSPAVRDEARTGLYVHVPFCATHCTYCDFSSGHLSAAAMERYLSAVELECARRAPEADGVRFTSLFFGGGTPSALSGRQFERVCAALRANFELASHPEITLEANPESVRPALLEAWARAGVNRLSMGAQSFVPEELERLGRIHSAERPAAAFALARAAGFERLSLDLMFGYPGHTTERWAYTLERALELEPEHVSAYCFIPEPGTPLGNAVASGEAALPDSGEQSDHYERLTARLHDAGLGAYETSNFSRPGAEARHNLVYWLRRPYLGLGPSAHGFMAGERYGNHYAMARWAAALESDRTPEVQRERERPSDMADEILMLGLRLSTGLQSSDHPPEVWAHLALRYGRALEAAVKARRLDRGGDAWWIPAPLRFVADDVIAWIGARALACAG